MVNATALSEQAQDGIDAFELDALLGYKLRRAQVSIFNEFAKRFARHYILPVDYSVICLVHANPGIRPSDIADTLGVKPANLAGVMKRLEARDLLRREVSSSDKRSQTVHLTVTGRREFAEWRKTQLEFDEMLRDCVGGAKEVEDLIVSLNRLIASCSR